jgi:hypothetical protein
LVSPSPHRFHPAKPGKIHIVYDAAVKFKGTSLNDELLHGHNLANEIIEVLLRFCKEVTIAAEDRDSLRFLWSSNNLDDPEEYHMNVHIFGAKDPTDEQLQEFCQHDHLLFCERCKELRLDEAGCYHNNMLLATLKDVGKRI